MQPTQYNKLIFSSYNIPKCKSPAAAFVIISSLITSIMLTSSVPKILYWLAISIKEELQPPPKSNINNLELSNPIFSW